MRPLSLAIVLAASLAAPAFAVTPGKTEAPKTAPAKVEAKAKPEEKLICTREKSTDSFMTKRVCRTQAQIDAERRGAQGLQDQRDAMTNRVGVIQ